MKIHSTLLLVLTAALSACHSVPTLPAGTTIGEEMQPQEIVRFRDVDQNPSAFFNRTVLVEATAANVCKTKGCWMEIEDDARKAYVRWETGCGGKYAFPQDAPGQRILIQGSFYPKKISPEDAEHMEEEAGKKLDVALDTYEFNASAVRLIDKGSAE